MHKNIWTICNIATQSERQFRKVLRTNVGNMSERVSISKEAAAAGVLIVLPGGWAAH